MSEKTKNLGIRVTPAERLRLRRIADERGTSVQGLFERAMAALLSSDNPASAASDSPKEIREDQTRKSPIPPEAQSWLDLVERALPIEDADWREMLDYIKTQLEQVAKVADREQENRDRNRGDLPESESGRGVGGAGGHRGKFGGATHGGRKKAG